MLLGFMPSSITILLALTGYEYGDVHGLAENSDLLLGLKEAPCEFYSFRDTRRSDPARLSATDAPPIHHPKRQKPICLDWLQRTSSSYGLRITSSR